MIMVDWGWTLIGFSIQGCSPALWFLTRAYFTPLWAHRWLQPPLSCCSIRCHCDTIELLLNLSGQIDRQASWRVSTVTASIGLVFVYNVTLNGKTINSQYIAWATCTPIPPSLYLSLSLSCLPFSSNGCLYVLCQTHQAFVRNRWFETYGPWWYFCFWEFLGSYRGESGREGAAFDNWGSECCVLRSFVNIIDSPHSMIQMKNKYSKVYNLLLYHHIFSEWHLHWSMRDNMMNPSESSPTRWEMISCVIPNANSEKSWISCVGCGLDQQELV